MSASQHRSGARSIAVNTFSLASASVFRSLARAIYAVLLARYLGVAAYGIFNYGLAWYLLFVPLAILGLDRILVREVARHGDQAAGLIDRTFTSTAIAAVAVAVISVLVALWAEADKAHLAVLVVLSFAIVGRGLASWAAAVFRACEASHHVLRLEMTFGLLEVVLGTALLMLGFGVVEVAALHASIWLLQGLSGCWLVRSRIVRKRLRWDATALLSLTRLGAPFVLTAFLTYWLMLGPIIVFKQLGDAATLGQLALAMQALYIIGNALNQAGAAALPVLSRSVARDDGKADVYLALILRLGIFLGGGLVIVALALGEWLINLLLGSEYAMAAQLLPWTLAMTTLHFWRSTLEPLLVADGHAWRISAIHAVGAAVFTLSAYGFPASLGPLGVLSALAVGLLVIVLLCLWLLRKHDVISALSPAARAAAAACCAAGIAVVTRPAGPWGSLAIGIATLATLTLVFRAVTRPELRQWVGDG